MATQFEIDCALMAGRAYQTSRASSGINWFPVPSGWFEVQHVPNPVISTSGGFEMSVFQNTSNPNNIVISFAGTNPTQLGDWTSGNVPLAVGVVSDQLKQAVDYYLQVRKDNSNANITFTGHSNYWGRSPIKFRCTKSRRGSTPDGSVGCANNG